MALDNSDHRGKRAEEARAIAVQMMDPHTKAVMLGIKITTSSPCELNNAPQNRRSTKPLSEWSVTG